METYKVGLALEPDNQELKDGLAYAYATGHVVCVVSYVLLDARARPRYGRTPRSATAGSAHTSTGNGRGRMCSGVIAKINDSNSDGKPDQQRLQRAMADPEIQEPL